MTNPEKILVALLMQAVRMQSLQANVNVIFHEQ